MYCHIHNCHYHHCNCVPTDSKEKSEALIQKDVLELTQELKQELKDYSIDLKNQIFDYTDSDITSAEVLNSLSTLKDYDRFLLTNIQKNTANLRKEYKEYVDKTMQDKLVNVDLDREIETNQVIDNNLYNQKITQAELNKKTVITLSSYTELKSLNPYQNMLVRFPVPYTYNGDYKYVTYEWFPFKNRREHDGVNVISPTVPPINLLDARSFSSVNTTAKQRQEYLYRKGAEDPEGNSLGAWVLVDNYYPIPFPKITFKKTDHIPKGNSQLYGRRITSSGRYVYSLNKGGYDTSSDSSYLSIYYTRYDGSLELKSWRELNGRYSDYRYLDLIGNYLYVLPLAAFDHYRIFDISNPSDPVEIIVPTADTVRGGATGESVMVGGILYKLVWGFARLNSFDVSNPLNPRLLDSIYNDVSTPTAASPRYDKRGYIWGCVYARDPGSPSIVRYKLGPNGKIEDMNFYTFEGVFAVRRNFFKDNRIYTGRFNDNSVYGYDTFVINVEDPDNPYLERVLKDMFLGDLAIYGDIIHGSPNSPLGDYSIYVPDGFKDGQVEYTRHIIFEDPINLCENHMNGAFGYYKNGTVDIEVCYIDFGFEWEHYERSLEYTKRSASERDAGRFDGQLLNLGDGFGSSRVGLDIDSTFSFARNNSTQPILGISALDNSVGVSNPSFNAVDLSGDTVFKEVVIGTVVSKIDTNKRDLMKISLKSTPYSYALIDVHILSSKSQVGGNLTYKLKKLNNTVTLEEVGDASSKIELPDLKIYNTLEGTDLIIGFTLTGSVLEDVTLGIRCTGFIDNAVII